MGMPQYPKNESKNKDKKKRGSHKKKPSPTMPVSSSSSMDPQNGSAQDHNGQSSRRHGQNSHSQPSRHSQQHRTETQTANGGQECYGSQTHEPPYNSAYTYAMYPPEQRVPVPPAAHHADEQYYYPPEQVYTNDAGAYASELRFDEDQAPSQDPLYGSSPGANQYDQPADYGYHRPQSPTQQYSVQQHVSTSSTTARWYRETTPEERLRLGLSRYPTQAEVEAARRRYEEAMQQADRYGFAPQ